MVYLHLVIFVCVVLAATCAALMVQFQSLEYLSREGKQSLCPLTISLKNNLLNYQLTKQNIMNWFVC